MAASSALEPASRKSTLSWRSAAKIAWRDMRSSTGKFLFVGLSVAIGVAALTGVRGFSDAFRRTLLLNARTIMAADLSARMFQQPSPEEQRQLNALSAQGIKVTSVTELMSMASTPADPNPLLISLKAVNPADYPFYGSVVLQPAGDLRSVLTDSTVVVGEDLLLRLHAKVGDQLKIGGKLFRIAAVLVSEPDRLSATMGLGPRVMMTRSALEETTLLQPGSRSGQRFLFKLPPQRREDVDAVKAQLIKALPEAQVTDFRETNPALTQGLDRSTSLLSLMSLVAMVLGAVGVAMAMRAHLQQRLDTIAIMKSMGARSSQIMKIYLLQTLLLGLAGGLVGVTLGVGVQAAFPLLLAKYIPLKPDLSLQIRAVLTGIGTGVLTTLMFTLPPLLEIRDVRPSLILRRGVETTDGPAARAFFLRVWEQRIQVLAVALILAGLVGIASTLSDSMAVGRWFAAGLAVALAVLLGMSALLLRAIRWILGRARMRLPSQVRHGLANLYRPGNQSAAVLASLGTGVMLIMTVFLMQRAVVGELHLSSKPDTPNIFLVDIGTSEVDGVAKLMRQQPGMRGPVEMLPVVAARLISVDGVAGDQLKLKNFPRRMLRSISLSSAEALPMGTKVVQGGWWKPGADGLAGQALVAIDQRMAQRLNVHVGSSMVFASDDREIHVKVAALTKSDGQHAYSRAELILPAAALKGLPEIWYGAVHIDPADVGTAQRALYATYPSITVINVADALETIRGVVMQIALVVQFLAAFSIFAGVIILASSIAGTRYRRTREVVVLKTLGATRARIAAVFSVEFLVLGLVAGTVGVLFANLLTRVLLHRMDVAYQVNWMVVLAGILGTALLANATGWFASFRILGQKPLEVLRED